MAGTDPVPAHLHWLGDDAASRGRGPDMVNKWTADDLPTKFDDSRFPRHPWNPSPYLMADLAVWLNEHHPKPAREVTRDDLPDFGAMGSVMARWKVSYGAVSGVLDAVVAHLNANGGLPDDDRWRRAHAIVEQERDQARESLRRLRDEKDFDLFTVRDQLKQCRGEREQMTRERDEWRERAEAAEARTAPAVTRDPLDMTVRELIREVASEARNAA